MDQAERQHRDRLRLQIQEVYGQMLFSYSAHVESARRIKRFDLAVKWLQIGTSAITVGGCLSVVVTDAELLAVLSALTSSVSLALASYTKNINFALDGERHEEAAKELWTLRGEYLSLLTDFDSLTLEEISQRRNTLRKRLEEIYAKAPIVDGKSHSRAQRDLKIDAGRPLSGEQVASLLPGYLQHPTIQPAAKE